MGQSSPCHWATRSAINSLASVQGTDHPRLWLARFALSGLLQLLLTHLPIVTELSNFYIEFLDARTRQAYKLLLRRTWEPSRFQLPIIPANHWTVSIRGKEFTMKRLTYFLLLLVAGTITLSTVRHESTPIATPSQKTTDDYKKIKERFPTADYDDKQDLPEPEKNAKRK